jgi:hypothetical protein
MAMREDCRHFETRTYTDDGEVARFCTLGLAPEEPWRCPEPCDRYERSMIDPTFVTGPASRPPVEDEPEAAADDVAGVLKDAEAIVEHAESDAIREVEEADATKGARRWWRFGKRRGSDGGEDGFRLSSR